ncbi:MFS transporter [Phenylobacterium sp.]|uniref:MFS transporter n=1 Tax=Phenylobacterium sp. TaxID=1871053 RepID=UPI002730F718|nr:MFS transporter [Phenylobacterium sp.]MDP1617974.1 MFS transporter [Phenylobacterium sp.]MDP1988807.1 MFS transporter [Phenylobacterium sp.]
MQTPYASGWRLFALLAALVLINALGQIDRILPFILAEAIKTDLSLSDTQIGLLTGVAFAVCYTLLSLPLARAADRGSPRIVLLICLGVWSAMTALGGMAASFLFLALTRFGVAVGEAGAIPSGHALIARLVPPERRGLAIGLFSMGIPLGTMIGFAAGGAMADTLGWRTALVGFGAAGGLAALLALLVIRPTPPLPRAEADDQPFLASALRLAAAPGFRWLLAGGVAIGFGTAPFYAFSAPFLIRTHGFTAGEVGLAFGLLQGLMGVLGTLLGGRAFDRAAQSRTGHVLRRPALALLIAAPALTAGLFAPEGWMSIALFVPGMFAFAFLLPSAFGAAHLVAGAGRQALASSLMMVASGLLGPALGPVIVGMISDTVAATGLTNSLGFGLLIVPVGVALSGLACLIADQRISAQLRAAPVNAPRFSYST